MLYRKILVAIIQEILLSYIHLYKTTHKHYNFIPCIFNLQQRSYLAQDANLNGAIRPMGGVVLQSALEVATGKGEIPLHATLVNTLLV